MFDDLDYHIVMLNGPPRCGKDAFKDALLGINSFGHSTIGLCYAFDDVLLNTIKPYTRALGAPTEERDWRVWYEENKHKPVHDILNCSVHDPFVTLLSMIASISEDGIKVQFGKDIYGRVVASKITHVLMQIVSDSEYTGRILIIIPDLSFEKAAMSIVNRFGKDRVTILHIIRPKHGFGMSFYDSVVDIPCNHHKLNNSSTLSAWGAAAKKWPNNCITWRTK